MVGSSFSPPISVTVQVTSFLQKGRTDSRLFVPHFFKEKSIIRLELASELNQVEVKNPIDSGRRLWQHVCPR